MTQYKRIGLDTSKAVFTLHGVDQQDRPLLRINLRRPQLLAFFKRLPPTEIAMEACGSAHYWARELTSLGHQVRLIPPQYVKPYLKRGKNDRNDAEAICEAAGRPGMHFVPVKSVTQQAQGMVLKVRETLVGQRTQLVNTLRGHAAEFGVISHRTDVGDRDQCGGVRIRPSPGCLGRTDAEGTFNRREATDGRHQPGRQ